MKMSKEQLKAIVKECLLELLSEGLGDVSRLAPRREPQLGRTNIGGVSESKGKARRTQEFDPRLDTPIGGANAALRESIKRNAGGNSIMESIFADTAMTTLQSQLAHGDSGGAPVEGTAKPSGVTQQEQFSGTPEQMFGEETASRWADLAFMESPTKKTA